MLRRYKFLWVAGALVALLVAARIALPYVVEDQANKRLMALPEYDGHVADVDIALWRGAYRLDGIEIVKTGVKSKTPFFSSRRIDLSVEWRSLLRGSFVATCELWEPQVNLVQADDKSQSQLGQGVNWKQQLEKSFPFRFNTIRMNNGTVTFRAPAIRTEDALKATNVDGEITNMTNVIGSEAETFAGFKATGTILGDGTASVNGAANPLESTPTFDVNMTVKGVQLPKVNPWLREYIKADAEAGEFELYTELAAADGRFRGYAKPIMREVDIYSSEEPEKNPLKRFWEGIVDLAAKIVEDDETGQVAARIPLKGTIEDPEAGILETIASVLRNAFVSSFARSLEGSISIRDVKKNLAKVGGGKAKEEKEEDEEKSGA